MKDKVMIVSPAGANGNYIALTLLGLVDKFEFCYHMQGTHGRHASKIKHVHIWNDDLAPLLHDDSYIVLQNIFNEKFWFVIINWWEKNYHTVDPNDELGRLYGVTWVDSQVALWKDYKHPIVRAILNWFYAYHNGHRPECKRINQIKETFNFSAFYENHEALANEFKKFGIDYDERAYEHWRNSQKNVLESFDQIQNLDINKLNHDYQKAIKMGFLGIKNNLNEDECWEAYKTLLD